MVKKHISPANKFCIFHRCLFYSLYIYPIYFYSLSFFLVRRIFYLPISEKNRVCEYVKWCSHSNVIANILLAINSIQKWRKRMKSVDEILLTKQEPLFRVANFWEIYFPPYEIALKIFAISSSNRKEWVYNFLRLQSSNNFQTFLSFTWS